MEVNPLDNHNIFDQFVFFLSTERIVQKWVYRTVVRFASPSARQAVDTVDRRAGHQTTIRWPLRFTGRNLP